MIDPVEIEVTGLSIEGPMTHLRGRNLRDGREVIVTVRPASDDNQLQLTPISPGVFLRIGLSPLS